MDDGPIPAGRGAVARQIAEVIVVLDGEPGRRGSGYRVGPSSVLTAAHVVEDATTVRVRFNADLTDEWTTEAIPLWKDPRSDIAVLSITPHDDEPPVVAPRFGGIGDERAAVLTVRAVGFPRFKLKDDERNRAWSYRDSHQADGSVAVLSNRREGTLEVRVPPPGRDPEPAASPWEGMSGAAVWAGDRVIGVITKHHRSDGLGRLAAARLDVALRNLAPGRDAELRHLLGLPDVLPDAVPPSTRAWVRSVYQAQLRDIAPERLLDRGAELDELVGFCAGEQPYAWWQAGPWAGKSALMAWFALQPPSGVDVVSFFVTARLAGQSDSTACTIALIEQLAALVDEPPAVMLTAGARQGTLVHLMEHAAGRAREMGRRLLVVIDGLDEDTGQAGSPSIAALLPRRPPPEVRILVASRPHPALPDDVDADHPLSSLTPRRLEASAHARAVEHRARFELNRLLSPDPLHRDVLGLITAAGGGLTLADLAQLTVRPAMDIDSVLGGTFGRSLNSRAAASTDGHPGERVILFAHETLRQVAEQRYGGVGLDSYRERIHSWAATYRQRGWPADTPLYLLRSYSQMLAGIGELPRLMACGTDQARHDRMRRLTGGDALALSEISAAQQPILNQSSPDLTSLALLAVELAQLEARNLEIPATLPAVWARIGQPERAEGVIGGIPATLRHAAYLALVKALTANGDHERADRIAAEAETHIDQYSEPYSQALALAELAELLARFEEGPARAARLAEKAESLTDHITDPAGRERALANLVESVALGGDHDRAEALAEQVTDFSEHATAMARLTRAAGAGADRARTLRLADKTEALISQITDHNERLKPLKVLVEALATAGEHDRAETLTGQISSAWERARVLAGLAQALAGTGGHTRAATLITVAQELVGHAFPGVRASALTAIVSAATACGDHALAGRLADQAEAEMVIEQINDPDDDPDWEELAAAVANGGAYDRAETLARRIDDPYERMTALARLAGMAAEGDHVRAARLADEVEAGCGQIIEPEERTSALTQLAQAAGVIGNHPWAAAFIDAAHVLSAQIDDQNARQRALVALAETATSNGDHPRATRLATELQALVEQTRYHHLRAEALIRLARTVTSIGDFAWATGLITAAKALIEQDTSVDRRAQQMADLAQLAAANGDHARAAHLVAEVETLIEQITYPDSREQALTWLVKASTSRGDHERAKALAMQTTDPDVRFDQLMHLVKVTATDGDCARAARWADEAETSIRQTADPHQAVNALTRLMDAVAASGDHDRAARLADKAEELAGQPTNRGPWDEKWKWNSLARAFAVCGEHDRAAGIARRVADPGERLGLMAVLVKAARDDGDHTRAAHLADEAEPLLQRIEHPEFQRLTMTYFLEVIAAGGDRDQTERVITKVESLIGQITNAGVQATALAALAEAVSPSRQRQRVVQWADKATLLARQIDHPVYRADAMARFIGLLAVIGDHERAARLLAQEVGFAKQTSRLDGNVEALARLTEAAAAIGEHGLAAQLTDETETIVGQITYPDSRERALGRLAEIAAATGDHNRAEFLTDQMTNTYERACTLTRLVEAVAATSDDALAARWADEAETLLAQLTYPAQRLEVLTWLLKAVASSDGARALRLLAEAEALIDEHWLSAAQLVRTLVKPNTNTPSAPGDTLISSPLMPRARHHLAATLATGSWTEVVASLAHFDSTAATALINAVHDRWQFDTASQRSSVMPTTPPAPTPSQQAAPWMRRFLQRWPGQGNRHP
ncbi:trypsin-like peptidase domain-containing protein [Streptomyces sp. NPDC093544]|uniref:trypsin-like peptidase domain-containing protein n=1 Tax=Streptomyces sp. NPDC093544 TaxID=3155200 RepID=UPI00341D0194